MIRKLTGVQADSRIGSQEKNERKKKPRELRGFASGCNPSR